MNTLPNSRHLPLCRFIRVALSAACLFAVGTVAIASAPELDARIPDAALEHFKPTLLTGLARDSGYAEVNGLKMYYEIHGQGAPLIVMHGGLMNIDGVGPLIPALAEQRQVIAVELQGHGRTADIDRPISYEAMADDVAALIEYLEFGRADVFGFSMGGGAALQLAIRHPERVNRLIVVSAPFRGDAWYPEVRAGMQAMEAAAMTETIMYKEYRRLAPEPGHWSDFIDKMKAFLGANQAYDWGGDIARFERPALIVIADTDFLAPEHAAELARLLGGGPVDGGMGPSPATQLAVLPGTTHFDILYRLDLLLPALTAFLGEAGEARR
jgi:pimeloyl-ACP methyl ester carboxylesterase